MKSCKTNEPIDTSEGEVINFLNNSYGLEDISRRTGRSRCYIRRIAELNMIKHQTNSQAFSLSTRHAVHILALLGRHCKSIATSLGVGIGYVEQAISNIRGMSSWRKKLSVHKKIANAVKELMNARLNHPSWCRKDLKEHHN